jgi:uncharacterized protein
MTRLSFPGGAGAELVGVLERPEGQPRAGIVLAHCFSCSKDLKTMTRMASGLRAAGYAVLRFDFTGLGDSEGDFGTSNVASSVDDVIAAAEALGAEVPGPLGLFGHSLGGAAGLLAARSLDRLGSVVTLGTPSSPAHLRRHLPDGVVDPRDEDVEVSLAGRRFVVRRGFLDDLEEHDQLGAVAHLGRPLLVLHALDDELVPIGEGERLFAAARQPKGFVPLLDADHLLGDRRASARAVELAVGWFAATLPAPTAAR